MPFSFQVFCLRTRRVLIDMDGGMAAPLRDAIFFRLYLYLGAFILVRVWGIANRLQNAVDVDSPMFILYLAHSIASPLQVRRLWSHALLLPRMPCWGKPRQSVSRSSPLPVCAWLLPARCDFVQGFFNALVYGLNRSVRKQYRLTFEGICCCCPRGLHAANSQPSAPSSPVRAPSSSSAASYGAITPSHSTIDMGDHAGVSIVGVSGGGNAGRGKGKVLTLGRKYDLAASTPLLRAPSVV